MTPEQLKFSLMLLPCLAVLGSVITVCTWHYWHTRHAREHVVSMRQREIDAAQAKIDKEAEDARQMKQIEVSAEHDKQQWQNAYEEAIKDIGTKYALYCPGCGKIMTLQHASRLPADLQAQMMYVPPPAETEEKEDEEPRGRRPKNRK